MLSALSETRVSVRQVSPEDRGKLASLLHFESFVHRHLDWRSPLEWIDCQPFLVAVQKGDIVGALACPVDCPNAAWIQVFAAKNRLNLEMVWNSLWQDTRLFYQAHGQATIAAIGTQPWFTHLLLRSQFRHDHNVVVLAWEDQHPLPKLYKPAASLRHMEVKDLDEVSRVDAASFEPLWQQSRLSLEFALQQATIASVAELEGRIVGYQLSTSGHFGGHLARLAVHPECHHRGIGSHLVYHVLEQFKQRGVSRVTVNTPQKNLISIRLYEKAGFQHTGEAFQVFVFQE